MAMETNPDELKPLPASAEDFMEEMRLFENLHRDSDPPPRAKLYHCLLSSAKIKRPCNSAMILLVGSSGVGKSSTINHLLDTGEGTPVAVTSSSKSETKTTREYILTTDNQDYAVCDLKMGIIDTPGFNDDDAGVKQDACNFVSIKRFFETHPGLPNQLTYPNLVFLVVNVLTTRIEREKSSFSKCLRGIKLLKVVDTSHPNLVVIATFCCSFGHRNVKKWEKKIQEKKDAISATVFNVLGVSAPVVLIENDFDDHELEKAGDFTILPNSERQPKNLYDACAELLDRNKDRFGLLAFNSCFTRAKKDPTEEGHKVEAKDSQSEELSDEEEEFSNAFSDDAKGGLNRVGMFVNDYVKENKLDKTQQEKVLKLGIWMNSMGLSKEGRLQSVSLAAINCLYDGEITDHCFKMLQQKFGIKNESDSSFSADVVGRGYNILLDKSVTTDIFKLSAVNETKYGFNIPTCAEIVKVNETREFQMNFQSDELHVKHRLKCLGVSLDFAQNILRMAPKFEASANQKENGSSKSTKTTTISLQEYRIAKIIIGNFESQKISTTDDFVSAVEKLPDQYTGDEKCKHDFMNFFNRFGHFVVTSAYVGGAVEVKTFTEGLEASKQDDNSVDGSVGADLSGVIGTKVGPKYQVSTEMAKKTVLDKTETRWNGGRSALHTKSTLFSEEKFLEWKLSLPKEPAMLTTEMNLENISNVVATIDKKKGEVCHQALRGLFDDKDLQPVHDEKEKCQLEEKKNEEKDMEEQRREVSNTREESIKEPDTEGWKENVTGNRYLFGGGVIVVLALAVIRFLFNR
ncbi:uncharacterized protein LOC114536605 [Dendronephthya gigantea]|uniref:uncharacterized protein LOC114536605 n=1 Tax=Dendronephthya gigantea TaxID=151771 RepID=UPI00106C4A1C|nr:uncharacterized protein LOC114536605 [Dendronephthya gigantea]XP_028413763.1 uncharacterized protein LOC114536605 [Dendronephthya gigantea]